MAPQRGQSIVLTMSMAMSVALLLLLLLHFTTSEHDDYNNVARYDNTDMHDINASEIDKQTTHTYKAITDTLTDTLRSLIETKTNSHDPLFPLTTSDYLVFSPRPPACRRGGHRRRWYPRPNLHPHHGFQPKARHPPLQRHRLRR